MGFGNKQFISKKAQEQKAKTFFGKYERRVKKNSFLYFGLPMMLSVALGSILLSNFTALRYERRDAKVKELDEQESLNLANQKRRTVNIKDEYYKLQGLIDEHEGWEPKRVDRLPGESENKW